MATHTNHLEETDEPNLIKETKEPNHRKKIKKTENKFINAFISIMQFAIPMAISYGLLYWIAGSFSLWKLKSYFAMPIFYLCWIITGSLIYFLFWWLTDKAKEIVEIREEETRIPRWKNWKKAGIKFILGVVLAIALAQIPTGPNTGTTWGGVLINAIAMRGEYPFISDIGKGVISSTNNDTKVQGIRTLSIIHSTMCLEQLFAILNQDRNSIKDWSIYDELKTGLASYGKDAKGQLLDIFNTSKDTSRGISRGLTNDLYSRYFSRQFDALTDELRNQILESNKINAQVTQVQEIQSNLQSLLTSIENESLQQKSDDPTLDFVLDTFLQMDIKSDSEIYYLSKIIADDSTYSDGVRGKALLLIAKLGSKNDFGQLSKYILCDNEYLRAMSYEAIGNLHEKIKPKFDNSN
jgi:hypothetical protein